MKILSIGLLILCMMNGCARTVTTKGYIKGKRIEGYIFPKEYVPLAIQFEEAKERYTPTEQDISKVEQIINDQLGNINQPLVNQGGDCPIIQSNLQKYKGSILDILTKREIKLYGSTSLLKKIKSKYRD